MTAADDLERVDQGEPLVELDSVSKYFQSDTGLLASLRGSKDVQAVDDVSFDIRKGETLALVGESGCGKSTLARAILQLKRPTDGTVRFRGADLTDLSDRQIRPVRQEMQMIFQDPQSSLDPRMTVGEIIKEPMDAHDLYSKQERRERVRELLEQVGLEASHYDRYPHEFSGGQRQRVNMARALSTNPDLVVCDEPVSALDVSIQAQILNTMRDLQEEYGVTYLFISHDLSMIRYIADRVAVMYLGHIVELAEKEELFENPQHPYTNALLDAIPVPDPRSSEARARLHGDVPSPKNPPSGCRFRDRCPELIRPDADSAAQAASESSTANPLDSYEMTDAEWEGVRRFTRAVKNRQFAVDESASSGDVEAVVSTEFMETGIPEGPPGRVVREAIDHVADGGWTDAADLLEATFEEPSVCALERPAYTVAAEYGEGEHVAACHRHR
jgi:peptide/nickel transport system ATP-binding protein